MVTLSRASKINLKKVHCPICGARLCDVRESERIFLDKQINENGIIIKCHKCGNKINVTIN